MYTEKPWVFQESKNYPAVIFEESGKINLIWYKYIWGFVILTLTLTLLSFYCEAKAWPFLEVGKEAGKSPCGHAHVWVAPSLTEVLSKDFNFFLAAPAVYGNSWARGWTGSAAEVCAAATATLDLSRICDLHHSLWQRRIFNPLMEAKDQTCILMDTILGS